ncbi:MAG: isocitrate lyase/phosphoenolpyruvate mutase family protein [Parvibaculum sp.]|nr:isocitrate lyase/phosphoenolpyruvate mutase family protein [Parvibaculum sp.]
MSRQSEAAQTFSTLHTASVGFIMPNAWDAGSAMILAAEGFKAIGTTSAGIAFSLGKQDYNVTDPALAVTRWEMFARMREIAAAVRVPVNGDLEAGFGDSPEDVAESIGMAIEAGLAGGNIEDKIPLSKNLYDEPLAVARIAAARAAIRNNAFVLTARTDVMQVPSDDPLVTIIRRANLFLEAGADCIFVPGVTDLPTITILLREIKGPINIVAGLGTAQGNAHEMIKAGVQRISLGGSIARSALGFIRQCARELRDDGTFTFASEQISGAEINALFAAQRPD